jgi:hypothetical protein
MDANGQITGGSQSVYTATTVEAFSIIWNNSGLPVVAFSIGFNRSLTAGERSALSSTTFWASILPAAINTANCTALYPFLPPDYQNIVGFWDASAITGLANNDPVTTWSDRSGLGNHVTQAGAASLKPTYKTTQQNSLPALSFDGGDWLGNTSLSSVVNNKTSAPISLVCAMKFSTFATNDRTICGFTKLAAGAPQLNIYAESTTGVLSYYLSGEVTKVGSSAVAFDTNPTIVSYRGDATTSAKIKNTSALNEVDTAYGSIGDGVIQSFCLGGLQTNALFYGVSGLYFETFLYKSKLTEANANRITAYLSAKWGIALS